MHILACVFYSNQEGLRSALKEGNSPGMCGVAHYPNSAISKHKGVGAVMFLPLGLSKLSCTVASALLDLATQLAKGSYLWKEATSLEGVIIYRMD